MRSARCRISSVLEHLMRSWRVLPTNTMLKLSAGIESRTTRSLALAGLGSSAEVRLSALSQQRLCSLHTVIRKKMPSRFILADPPECGAQLKRQYSVT